MSKFKLSYIFNIFFFTFIFLFFFLFPRDQTFAGVCTPGQRQCSGSCSYQVCNSTGNWGTSVSCPTNSGCIISGGVASCQSSAASLCGGASSCTNGSRRCSGGCDYQVCTNGTWGASQTCPANSGCTAAPAPYYASCQSSAASLCTTTGGNSGTCTQTPGQYCAPITLGCLTNTRVSGTCLDPTTQQPNGVCCLTSGGSGSGNPPPPPGTNSGSCVTCQTGTSYDTFTQMCEGVQDYGIPIPISVAPTTSTCAPPDLCYPGCGCSAQPCTKWVTFSSGRLPCGTDGNCPTAIGNINSTVSGIVPKLFGILLGLAGAIALILIIVSGYKLMMSQGNPEATQGAKEQFTAALIGLLFIIFSFVILKFVGVDVLGIFP